MARACMGVDVREGSVHGRVCMGVCAWEGVVGGCAWEGEWGGCEWVGYEWEGGVGWWVGAGGGWRVGGSANEHKGGGRVKEGRRSEASVDLLERALCQSVDQAEDGTAFTLFSFVFPPLLLFQLLIPSVMEVGKLTHSSQAAIGRTQGVHT